MKSLILILCVSSLLIVLPLVDAAAEKSLVLYLPFDGTLEDLSNTGLKGKLNGKADYVNDGKPGKALQLSGGVAEIPHHKLLNMTAAHTISFWLKWDGAGASWCPFIAKRTAAGANFQSWVGSDKIFDYYNGAAVVSATTPVPLGKDWIFLATTHDGKDKVSFYVNGVLNSEKKAPPGKANSFPLLIGHDGVGNAGAGIVDELAMFSRELKSDEIETLMEDGVKVFASVEPTGKLTTTWGRIKQ